MKVQTILERQSLSLNYESHAADDVKAAIKATILGNPDGIRYRQFDALRKIGEIKPLHFFPLRRNGELIYVMALAERITKFSATAYHCYYVRYVSFSPKFYAKDLSQSRKQNKIKRLGNSFMKEGISKHADSFSGELQYEATDISKSVYYAYVEETNLRSMNFTEFFFEPIRKFSIITYSSLFPKKDERFSKLGKQNVELASGLLKLYYSGHSFYFLNKDDLEKDYYVLKAGGKILAGLKAQTANWEIDQIPGLLGKLLQFVVPYLPVFSRILKPGKFRFLTFDSIYCSAGNEALLPILFRSVCAELKVYAAMLYLDEGDPLHESISRQKQMGVLNKLFKTARASVVARFVNFSEEEKAHFKKAPVFISGYDLT